MISSPFPDVQHGYASSLPASVSQKAQLLADLKGMEAVNFRERIQTLFHHSRQNSASFRVRGRLGFSRERGQPLCGRGVFRARLGDRACGLAGSCYVNRDFHFTQSPAFLICCLLSWLLSKDAMLLPLSLMTKKRVRTPVGLAGRGGHAYASVRVVGVSGAALCGTCMVKI